MGPTKKFVWTACDSTAATAAWTAGLPCPTEISRRLMRLLTLRLLPLTLCLVIASLTVSVKA